MRLARAAGAGCDWMEIRGGALLRERVEQGSCAGETRFAISDAHRVQEREARPIAAKPAACAAGTQNQLDALLSATESYNGETNSGPGVVGNVGRAAITVRNYSEFRMKIEERARPRASSRPPLLPDHAASLR